MSTTSRFLAGLVVATFAFSASAREFQADIELDEDKVLIFEGATEDGFEGTVTIEDVGVDTTFTFPADDLEADVLVDYEEWDVILRDPSCDEIQQAINSYLDEDTPGDGAPWRVKLSGQINGDGVINESDLSGRNLSGDATYQICVAVVPTSGFTSNFPDSDASSNLGSPEYPLHIHFQSFQVELEDGGSQTEPMIFLQIGDGYHHGRTSTTTDNWNNGAWVRDMIVTGELLIFSNSHADARTWPEGRIPRLPLDSSNYPQRSHIGIFANSMTRVDMSGLTYRFVCDSREAGSIGWLKTAGWSNRYPNMNIHNCSIGTWWHENSIGQWPPSLINTNGINNLFGGVYGGSAPLELTDNSTCTGSGTSSDGDHTTAGCCTGSTAGTCAPIDGQEVHGINMVGVQGNEGIGGSYVFMDARHISGVGLRSERVGIGRPTDEAEHTGDKVAIGAGYCDGGTDAYRNSESGNSLTDMVCTSDEQCNNGLDGTGSASCVITDHDSGGSPAAGTDYEITGIYLHFDTLSSTDFHNRYATIALGPGADPGVLSANDLYGPHVVIEGRLGFVDSDRTTPGNWTSTPTVANLGSGNCPATNGTRCWVGDRTNAETVGVECTGDGVVDHTDDTDWQICNYDSGDSRWEHVADDGNSGVSCAAANGNVDCAPLYANPGASIKVDLSNTTSAITVWNDSGTTHYSGLVGASNDELCTVHATDCTAQVGCTSGTVCYEQDANTLYACEPSAGSICESSGDWQGPL